MPPITCFKCKLSDNPKNTILCNKCKCHYHYECIGYSEKLHRLKAPVTRTNWTCSLCRNKTDRNTTPKMKINISTSNSFQSLSDEEYSLTSPITQLNSSCPLISMNTEEKIKELERQKKELLERIASADNEIENLLSENFSLKKQLANYETTTKYLKDICSSSAKKNVTKRRKRENLSSRVLDFSQVQEKNISTPKVNSTTLPKNSHKDTLIPDRSSNYEHEVSPKIIQTPDIKEKSIIKPKIYIIGDEQVRGLAQEIIRTRSGKWNDNYEVSSMVKPSASSSQILNSCIHLKDFLNAEDIIVLSVGSIDKNPYTVISNLCNTLCTINLCKIFILSVQHSDHVNTDKLNSKINFIIKNYKNCSYVNIKELLRNSSMRDMSAKNLISLKLNTEIDHLKYVNDYITNIKKQMQLYKNKYSGQKENQIMIPSKKGTIPYYFRISNVSSPKINQSQMPKNEEISFFRSQITQ